MKKLAALFLYALAIPGFSCMHSNDSNITLNFNESGHYYSMYAHFGKSKTRSVERYMDNSIGKKSNMSFVNSQIDGTLTLDDNTTFYVKKYPGFLKIKLDKDKNSDESCEHIKSMCEGIKSVLAK